MSDIKKIVLVGIGGYGGTYAHAVLSRPNPESWKVVGVVDPMAEKAAKFAELKAQGIPFFNTLDEFYQTGDADLAVMATPIQLHCEQACNAMAHGSNVLCEKPVSAVPEQAEKMIEVSKKTGKFLAIGYQWSFSPAVLDLKADIMAGKFGAPKRLRSLVLWPRTDAYYARNNWAGGQKSPSGDWILDSPVNNACAHYLHNMLYVIGDKLDTAAQPKELTAELYRANNITNYDTASLRVITNSGVEILFQTSHAISRLRGPEFIYEFEKGTATFNIRDGQIRAKFANGETKVYGNPNNDSTEKFWDAIAALRGEKQIPCTAETAIMQTRCVWAAQQSVPEIPEFPVRSVYKAGVPGHQVKVVEGLAEALERAYAAGTMLHEQCSAPWISVGKTIKI